MSNKMERFTQRARRVLSLAQEEAERMQHDHIGTGHLLMGLARDDGGVAGRVLRELGCTYNQTDELVERFMRGAKIEEGARMDLALSTKQVLEFAIDEARLMSHHYIGTEHLLLGLLRQPEGVHHDVFREMNISPDEIRYQMRLVLQENPLQAARRPSSRRRPASRTPRGEQGRFVTPLTDQLTTDLTRLAADEELDPVSGRAAEIDAIIACLCRRYRHNPLLVGELGVGKTSIVRGLALRIAAHNVPPLLQGKRLVQLEVSSLIAGTMYRGQFEERAKRLIEELETIGAILFITDLHLLVGAGLYETKAHRIGVQPSVVTGLDAASLFNPSLDQGAYFCIGEMTTDAYQVLKNLRHPLLYNFQAIRVDEPSVAETIDILRGTKQLLEDYHMVTIDDDAVELAAQLADQHLAERFLPDKAIELLDRAAVRVRLCSAEITQAVTTADVMTALSMIFGIAPDDLSTDG